METLTFQAQDLHRRLHAATPEEMDSAAFGIVQLDPSGSVSYYNRYESDRAGLSPERVIGRNFFTDIAPCTNNFMVAQKFVEPGELDEFVDYVFTFRMRPTKVRLRLLMSLHLADRYVVVQRL